MKKLVLISIVLMALVLLIVADTAAAQSGYGGGSSGGGSRRRIPNNPPAQTQSTTTEAAPSQPTDQTFFQNLFTNPGFAQANANANPLGGQEAELDGPLVGEADDATTTATTTDSSLAEQATRLTGALGFLPDINLWWIALILLVLAALGYGWWRYNRLPQL